MPVSHCSCCERPMVIWRNQAMRVFAALHLGCFTQKIPFLQAKGRTDAKQPVTGSLVPCGRDAILIMSLMTCAMKLVSCAPVRLHCEHAGQQ